MKAAKLKARQILSGLNIDQPDLLRHLKEICCERGAFVKEAPLQGSEGRLVVKGDRGIITVKPSENYVGRTRFSIAHELGHFELHRALAQTFDCDTQDMNDWSREKIELEANEFAAELLLPEKFVKPAIKREPPSLSHVKEIANHYRTSLTATACRFIELTGEACAVVFSRDGSVTHFWRSRAFDRGNYRLLPGKLDPKTLAKQVAAGKAVPARMTEMHSSLWLDACPSPSCYEQSDYFRGLKMGISLIWVPAH